MIDIQKLSFSYSSKQKLFADFSLQLRQNCIYGLLGKNGTGKTTLLYLIAGLLRPSAGFVCCDIIAPNGQPLSLRSSDRRPELLEQLFFVPEEFELPFSSLDTFVRLNAPFYPHFSREVLDACLREFELSSGVMLATLSMGQKKKVLISFALATCTRYLLMDEPTNGLDIPSKSQFRRVMAKYMNDDRTVIISTHQVHDVESLLDHILILSDSRLLLNASTAEITDHYVFAEIPVGSPSDAVYSEPSPQGLSIIAKRTAGMEETQLNLELLFNAVTKGAVK